MEFSLPDTAPKSIEEIGERTFRVKERLWALNSIGNLKYIWCKDMLNGTGTHINNPYPGVFPEIQMLQKRLEELNKNIVEKKYEINEEGTKKDIASIEKQIADFKAKECPECIKKYEFRLEKFSDSNSGEVIALGSGPSVLEKDGEGDNWKLLPKVRDSLKRSNIPILACDRSLIPCLKEGIIPKYVLAADGADHVANYFKGDLVKKSAKDIVAIFNVQTHPNVTKLWVDDYGGRVMWYNVALDEVQKGKSLSRYLFHMTNDNVISVPWGHVGGYAFGLGYLLGYNPIIFLGIDLGFSEEKDPIYDTPYWNPYFKATVREHIFKQIGVKIEDVNKMTDQKKEAYKQLAKSMGYDDQNEYMSKDKEFYDKHPELVQKTIKEHFHFYTNPFGNKVYHDNIFKAYKDIMQSFFIANPRAKIIQCSQYTTYFPQKCDFCKGKKQINQIMRVEKECFKCKTKHTEEEKGSLIACPHCVADTGRNNDKGEPIYESSGIKGNSIRCVDFDTYLNERLEAQILAK